MTDYTKSTNFASKDTLPSGSALKIVRGTEIDTEFNNIATSVATKADKAAPTFTGTVTADAFSTSGAVAAGSVSSTTLTVTGDAAVGSVTFEGATADAFETTLNVVDPTSDRTILLPNKSGTVALTSDISNVSISTGSGTYAISGSTTLTVTLTSHGRSVGDIVYLGFTSGTAVSGEFTVAGVTDANNFTVNYGSTLTTSGNVTVSYSNYGQTRIASLLQTIQGTSTDTFISPSVFKQLKLVSDTVQTTTSGTTKDFTIPSWVKRITVMFAGVSMSSTNDVLVQIGTGGTPATSGYSSGSGRASGTSASGTSSTAGMVIYFNTAANTLDGNMVLTNVTGNTWTSSHSFAWSNGSVSGGGSIALGGTMNILRIKSASTDTFDAGSINIMYE